MTPLLFRFTLPPVGYERGSCTSMLGLSATTPGQFRLTLYSPETFSSRETGERIRWASLELDESDARAMLQALREALGEESQ